jgi:hypothetical protein
MPAQGYLRNGAPRLRAMAAGLVGFAGAGLAPHLGQAAPGLPRS